VETHDPESGVLRSQKTSLALRNGVFAAKYRPMHTHAPFFFYTRALYGEIGRPGRQMDFAMIQKRDETYQCLREEKKDCKVLDTSVFLYMQR
jgi:hypothetical protein